MLVLFVIGGVDPKLLGDAKRVKEYRPSDYELVYIYANEFSEIVLLPNTISEASDLLDQLKGGRRERCMERLAQLVKGSSERYIASVSAMEQPEYMALGVADAAILCIAGKRYVLADGGSEALPRRFVSKLRSPVFSGASWVGSLRSNPPGWPRTPSSAAFPGQKIGRTSASRSQIRPLLAAVRNGWADAPSMAMMPGPGATPARCSSFAAPAVWPITLRWA